MLRLQLKMVPRPLTSPNPLTTKHIKRVLRSGIWDLGGGSQKSSHPVCSASPSPTNRAILSGFTRACHKHHHQHNCCLHLLHFHHHRWHHHERFLLTQRNKFWKGLCIISTTLTNITEVRFVTADTASVVSLSLFTNFLVSLSPKLLKFGEIKGVIFLAWNSGGVIFLTNLTSADHFPFYGLTCSKRGLGWVGSLKAFGKWVGEPGLVISCLMGFSSTFWYMGGFVLLGLFNLSLWKILNDIYWFSIVMPLMDCQPSIGLSGLEVAAALER